MKTNILAIETSSEACSVAVASSGKPKLQRLHIAPQGHARLLLPTVQEILAVSNTKLEDIDFFAYSQGPGSFTGLRCGISVIQGLAFGQNKPIIAICSLQALAWQAYQSFGPGVYVPMLDARMQEVYWAKFLLKDGEISTIIEPQVGAATSIALAKNETVCGIGAKVYLESEPTILYPEAQAIAELASKKLDTATTVTGAHASYVRNPIFNTKTSVKTAAPLS